jgi:hypothetical protein
MKVVRLYSGADGESHFEDYEAPLTKGPLGLLLSKPVKVKEANFRINEGNALRATRWHNVARRQFLVVLEGELFIEVGDGTKCRIGPGEILLAEDTTGRGHLTSGFNKSAFVVSIDETEPKL